MKIIDLTKPLYDHMPVYPGDPDVIITKIQTFEKEGWNMHRIQMNLHDGTHVNAPIHMSKNGKTLDDISLDSFWGQCELYSDKNNFNKSTGVIFTSHNIDMQIAEKLVQNPPKFIGLSEKFEFDIAVEKFLLEHEIISYENLANCERLPEKFTFYGFPLRIKDADGSPVRAVAFVE